MPPLGIGRGLDPLGRTAVDHAQDSAPLLSLSHDHLDRIRGGTENGANFGNFTDAAQHIDGIAVAHRDHEDMAGCQRLGVRGRISLQFAIVAIDADQARSGGFVKRDAEFHLRRRVDHGFIEILHRLDEVTLAHDDVAVLGDFEAD